MKRSTLRRHALLAAAAWPLAASALDLGRLLGGTKGSGNIVHREIDPGEFDSLEVGGDLEVVLRQARPPRVVVDIDDNLWPLLEARVRGRTLRLRPTRTIAPTRLAIVVDAWVLEGIGVAGSALVTSTGFVSKQLSAGVAGSARLRLDEFTAESLTLHLAGSAQARLAGRANEMDAAVAGSAQLAALGFEVRRVTIKVAGAGQADVWASDTLDGAVAGSAGLRYRGDPKLGVSRAGSATIGRKS